ncbi:MAG: NAD(+) synthase [Candidatus Gastranaerophilales bacterium]|nr:NAD(+) synthase [Candidatus Gastranaerophilales bacterium]
MNKIVLAQIDPIAGNISHNFEKIKEAITKAKEEKADLIIFPELSLFGYPFGDLISRHTALIKKQLKKLEDIASLTEGITALVGFIEPTDREHKKPYFNSIAVLQNGKKIQTVRKILLPSYCEFNDNRYFEPAEKTSDILELNGERFGIIICEDGFNDNDFFEHNLYEADPIEELIAKKADTIINCSSSPSRTRKEQLKHNLFSSIAKKYAVNYIYVNQVGYADDLCFDGSSRIYNTKGELTLRGQFFEEDFLISENYKGTINKLPKGLDKSLSEIKEFNLDYESDLDRTYRSIICAIKGYFGKNGFKRAVLGLSGGLDSSVSAVLLAHALGSENVLGISMPTKITSQASKSDAEILAKNLGIKFFETPIAEQVEVMKSSLNKIFDKVNTDKCEKSTTFENIQARLRATILWSISNEYKQMLPIATSDKSELYIGYATINGDMSGGFAPIADVTKTKLFALADFINRNSNSGEIIPKSILAKPPGAELKLKKDGSGTVTAEEENMPYEFLDEIIWCVENRNYGFEDLMAHHFAYEIKNNISLEQKKEWIKKFYWKSHCAIFKWHLLPPSAIVDSKSINNVEYHHPIISKFCTK